MVRKMKKLTLILILWMIFGCDSRNTYNYEAENNLNEKIKIEYKSVGNQGSIILDINPGNKTILYVDEDERGGSGVKDRQQDSIWVFDYIKVYKSDTILSPKNFKNRSEWSYKKYKKRIATYTTVIDNSDF